MNAKKVTRRDFIKYTGGAAAAGAALMCLPAMPRRAFGAAIDGSQYLIKNLAAPLYGNPAMILAGDSFTVRTAGGDCAVKAALLRDNDGKTWPLGLVEAETGLAASNKGLPPGLYDLEADIESAAGREIEIQKKSVAVYGEFKKTFDFVFASDLHFGGAETRRIALEDSGVYACRRWGLAEIPKYKPEFILLGGDLALYPPGYRYALPEGFEFLNHYLNIPLHAIPGNHDVYHDDVEEAGGRVDGREYWKKYYGDFYHSFDYGSMHFTGLNTSDWPDNYIEWGTQDSMWGGTLLNAGISKEQFDWMTADMKKAAEKASEVVVFNHIPLTWTISGTKKGFPPVKLPGVPLEKITESMEAAGVRYSFAGHVHLNQDRDLTPKIQERVIRNIGGKYIESEKSGFAVIHVENGRIAEIKRIDMA